MLNQLSIQSAYDVFGEEMFRPLSYTKLGSGLCPAQAEYYVKEGVIYDFKANAGDGRGQEQLHEGIALHELMDNWHESRAGIAEHQRPGAIFRKWNCRKLEITRMLEEIERFQGVFSYNEDGTPGFSGGAVVGTEVALHIDEFGNPVLAEDAETRESLNAALLAGNKHRPKSFFKATIDLMQWDEEEGTITLTDYKRQHNILSNTDARTSFQAMAYALTAFCHYPQADRVVFRFYFTRYGSFTEVQFTPSEVKGMLATIKELEYMMVQNTLDYMSLQTEETKYVAGEQCQFCPLASKCPKMKSSDIVERGMILNPAEASAAAAQLVLVNRLKSDLTDILKNWSKDHGAVEIDGIKGKQYGYVPQKNPSWECPKDRVGDFLALLEGQSEDEKLQKIIWLKDLLKIDGRALAKLVSKAEKLARETGDWEFHEKLTKTVIPKNKTTFREHKS